MRWRKTLPEERADFGAEPAIGRCAGRRDARPLRQARTPGTAAFTLVEILLALAIFSMLIAALYSTWILVMRATVVGKGRAAQLQRERITMHSIENALTCIQSHQASMNYYLFMIQNGDQPYLSLAADLPDSFPRSGEFEGLMPDGNLMDYHVRRVTFFLQPGENGEKDLVLQQNPILMPLTTAEQNTPLVLAKNVSDFLIECWDTNTMEWATEWDYTNIIPPLVRVTVAFGDKNSGGQVITREISFPSATMPSQVQSPNYSGIGGYNTYNNNFNTSPGGGQNGQGGQGGQVAPPGGGPNLFPGQFHSQ